MIRKQLKLSEFSVNIVLNLKVLAKQSYEVMSLLPVIQFFLLKINSKIANQTFCIAKSIKE